MHVSVCFFFTCVHPCTNSLLIGINLKHKQKHMQFFFFSFPHTHIQINPIPTSLFTWTLHKVIGPWLIVPRPNTHGFPIWSLIGLACHPPAPPCGLSVARRAPTNGRAAVKGGSSLKVGRALRYFQYLSIYLYYEALTRVPFVTTVSGPGTSPFFVLFLE